MSSNDNENDPVHWYQWEILHWQPYSQEYLGTVAETWPRDYDSITVGRAPLYLLKDVVLNTFLVNQTSTVVILASSIRICFNNVSLTDAKEYQSFEFLQWNIVTHVQTLKCLAVYQLPYSLAHPVLSGLFFDELSDYLENILMCPETLLVSQTSSISTLTTLSIMMPESFETWKPLDSHSMLWYQPIHVATPWILYF